MTRTHFLMKTHAKKTPQAFAAAVEAWRRTKSSDGKRVDMHKGSIPLQYDDGPSFSRRSKAEDVARSLSSKL